jgi:two-component system sensor kinase FixL
MDLQIDRPSPMPSRFEASTLALAGSHSTGVRVRFEPDPTVSHVLADRIQIQQVLVNLMRNALEAMAESARRELAIKAARIEHDRVEISVADTGTGIAEKVAHSLFDSFVSTKRDGMGLGLSICKSIVDAHGGRLLTEPNPVGGTIFRFSLAAAKDRGMDYVS